MKLTPARIGLIAAAALLAVALTMPSNKQPSMEASVRMLAPSPPIGVSAFTKDP